MARYNTKVRIVPVHYFQDGMKEQALISRAAEFRTFVEQAEEQLLVLFKSIDKDGNGKLDMKELQTAFKSAKLTVSNGRLSEFFNDMDMNNDGYVSFDEWRQVTAFSFSLFLWYVLKT